MTRYASKKTILKRGYIRDLTIQTLTNESIPFEIMDQGLLLVFDYVVKPETGWFCRVGDHYNPSDRGVYNLIRRLKKEGKIK